jgi:transcriptional regulator with XRE-family HTH domain
LLLKHVYDTKWIMTNDPKMVKVFLISAGQMRGARGLLGWSQTTLAAEAGMSLPTVKRYETGKGASVSNDAVKTLQMALEAAGVEFTNGDEPGVKLKRKSIRK